MRVAAVALCLALATAACASEATSAPPPTVAPGEDTEPTPPTFAPLDPHPTATFEPIGPDPTVADPAPSDPTLAEDLGLVIAPEVDSGYDRSRFEHWVDADYDGCDTRCEVLLAERRTDLPGIGTGWFSVYDWISTPNVADLDIDHLVPLAEAWRSGAHAWDDARRRAFANDLDEPDALVAVTASSNRQKGDGDPADWRPPRQEQWCWYATAWIRVKARWELTADPIEAAALRDILARC